MSHPGESPQLDYAPRPPKARRSRAYRWLIAAAILFALYLWRDLPTEIWQHYRILNFQQQCIKNPIPQGIMVYSTGPPGLCIASPQAATLASAYHVHPGWKSTAIVPTLFAGELRASNGIRRMVNLEAGVAWSPGRKADVSFFATVANDNWENNVGGQMGGSGYGWHEAVPPPSPEIVIYSATCDPSDPSHISFIIHLFGDSELWDGYLQKDGNFVLSEKSIPIVPAAAPAKK